MPMYPRKMNKKELKSLSLIKRTGFAYKIDFDRSPWSGGYLINVHSLMSCFKMSQPEHIVKELARYKAAKGIQKELEFNSTTDDKA